MRIVEDFSLVRCPISRQMEKVYYRYIEGTDIKDFQGCDNCCNRKECVECMKKALSSINPG